MVSQFWTKVRFAGGFFFLTLSLPMIKLAMILKLNATSALPTYSCQRKLLKSLGFQPSKCRRICHQMRFNAHPVMIITFPFKSTVSPPCLQGLNPTWETTVSHDCQRLTGLPLYHLQIPSCRACFISEIHKGAKPWGHQPIIDDQYMPPLPKCFSPVSLTLSQLHPVPLW